jgi:hypothetical protein
MLPSNQLIGCFNVDLQHGSLDHNKQERNVCCLSPVTRGCGPVEQQDREFKSRVYYAATETVCVEIITKIRRKKEKNKSG